MHPSSFYGSDSLLKIFDRYFGGWKMGDLKQKVLITTYDWLGDRTGPPMDRLSKPKVYVNFPVRFGDDEVDRKVSVADVADYSFAWCRLKFYK